MPLKSDTLLQRVPELNIVLISNNRARITLNGSSRTFGYHALQIVDAFYRPATMSEVVDQYINQVVGIQDWIDFTRTIVALYEFGVLVDINQSEERVHLDRLPNFANWRIHINMLNDWQRTAGFLAAIREVVTPDDIVVDIGTGTGVLAIAAAQAGAKHVYAIEATGMADVATQIIKANGVEDRVTMLHGWSTHLTLPEKATVLVSEIIGSDPLDENVFAVMRDAAKRLVVPDARFIPSGFSMCGLPLTIPPDRVARQVPLKETLIQWHEWYGIDFKPLYTGVDQADQRFGILPQRTLDWPRLSEPSLLANVDLKQVDEFVPDLTSVFTVVQDGILNGVMLYPELYLSPGRVLSRHPAQVDENNHWGSFVWLLKEAYEVKTGDQFRLSLNYATSGIAQLDVQPLSEDG